MQRGLAEEAHPGGFLGGALKCSSSIVEAVLGLGDATEHRLGVHQPPGVTERGQYANGFGGVARRAAGVAEHERTEGPEQEAGGGAPP